MKPNFKYFNSEAKSPFPRDDVRSNFWYGESVMNNTVTDFDSWVEYGKEIVKRLRDEGDETRLRRAEIHPPEEFGIIVYIETLFCKWDPYDTMEWIYEY